MTVDQSHYIDLVCEGGGVRGIALVGALEVLEEAGLVVAETEVLAIEVSDQPGGLVELLGLFEQAGINFSEVAGDSLPSSATARRPELAGRSFEAMGVSTRV